MESTLNAVVFVVGLVFLNLREMLRVKEAGGPVSFAKEMKDSSDDSIWCSTSVWYLEIKWLQYEFFKCVLFVLYLGAWFASAFTVNCQFFLVSSVMLLISERKLVNWLVNWC